MLGKTLKLPNLFFLPIILTAILILSINIDKPFVGHHDFMGAYIGKIAKNFDQYGLVNMKFGQVTGFIEGDIKDRTDYLTHYLPLVAVLTSLTYSLFGISEFSTRLVPATFSIFGLGFFLLTVEMVWDRKTAFLAGIFFIANPMFIYFGKIPAPEPIVLGLSLASIYFYLRWLIKDRTLDLIIACLLLFLGGLAGWPIVYLGPIFIIHSLLLKKFSWKLVYPNLSLFLTGLLLFIHAFILTGSFFGGGLITTFNSRFGESNLSFGGQDFSLRTYLKQEVSWLSTYYTKTMILLTGLYLAFSMRKRMDLPKSVLILFGLFGAAQLILFSRYVFIHDFLNIYLLPFFSLGGALGINLIIRYLKKSRINGFLQLGVVFLILIFFVTERLDYSRALLATNMNKPGIEMANLLNKLQQKDNQVAIASPRFSSFYGVFLGFYSNYSYRIVGGGDLEKSRLPEQIQYLITIDEDIIDKKLYNDLIARYKSERITDKTVFYLNNER